MLDDQESGARVNARELEIRVPGERRVEILPLRVPTPPHPPLPTTHHYSPATHHPPAATRHQRRVKILTGCWTGSSRAPVSA